MLRVRVSLAKLGLLLGSVWIAAACAESSKSAPSAAAGDPATSDPPLDQGGQSAEITGGGGVDSGDPGRDPVIVGGRTPINRPGRPQGHSGSPDDGDGAGGEPAQPPLQYTLGGPCSAASDCQPGLDCVTAMGAGAPPHGVCTLPCQDHDTCSALSPGSLCLSYGDSTGYCFEGCAFGRPPSGQLKCHGRKDFACNPALSAPRDEPCETAATCAAGELCIGGLCSVVFPSCLPSCRGDLDCGPGLFCEQAFLGGWCVPREPAGKKLGEPCTVPTANEPAEPDECRGFCRADSNGSQLGHCAATCGLGYECAWDATSQQFDGACLYTTLLTANGGFGDMGFCTPACGCNEQCNDPSLECRALGGQSLNEAFSGPGLCLAPDPAADDSHGACP